MLQRNLKKLRGLLQRPRSMDEPEAGSYKAAPREGGSESMAAAVKEYRPSDDEPFMNERQKEYFRQTLQAWKQEILDESKSTIASLSNSQSWIGCSGEPDVAAQPAETTRTFATASIHGRAQRRTL